MTHHPRNPVVDRALRVVLFFAASYDTIQRRVMKTFTLKTADIDHHWFVVDAAGQPLGRLASRVAQVLRGKHKPTFTPHVNGGDCVIVVNAERVKLTGRKLEQKRYFRHTGYMGH